MYFFSSKNQINASLVSILSKTLKKKTLNSNVFLKHTKIFEMSSICSYIYFRCCQYSNKCTKNIQ